MRVLHVVTELADVGGAETTLGRLLTASDTLQANTTVIALKRPGLMANRLSSAGLNVECLGVDSPGMMPLLLARLVERVRQIQPDLVQTWLYHADLAGGLATRLTSDAPVVWNVRLANIERSHLKPVTAMVARACAMSSRWLPRRIICCSEVSMKEHVARGYPADKMLVIPNGIDPSIYQPDPVAGAAVRSALGVGRDDMLIGMVARWHPTKNHLGFLAAIAPLIRGRSDMRVLMAGSQVDRQNQHLQWEIRRLGLEKNCLLMGIRHDMPAVLAAIDVLVSPSHAEGFPNVVAEAMACGVPCVVSDAGDSKQLVGETGFVASAEDVAALREAIRSMFSIGPAARRVRGLESRKRIIERYSLDSCVSAYEREYVELLKEHRAERRSPGL